LAEYDIQNLEILIVDDDANMCRLIRNILNSLGVKSIKTAGAVGLGYSILEDFHADIAICDLVMEPLTGIDFTRMVRTNEGSPNCYLPIIMLTGADTDADTILGLDAGANDYITKPFRLGVLLARLRAHIYLAVTANARVHRVIRSNM